MKQILPILLCYVLMTSQVFAISGGPDYGGHGSLNPIGTYSGLLVVNQELDYDNPVVDPVTGELDPSIITDVNAVGLFTLGVPDTSVATGAFLLFVNGDVYNGTIVASVDPDSDQLSGLLEGTYLFDVIDTSFNNGTVTTVTAADSSSAAGPITASIGGSRANANTSARFNGSATLDVILDTANTAVGAEQDRRLICTVTGFRQSQTFSNVSSIGTATGSATGSGTGGN